MAIDEHPDWYTGVVRQLDYYQDRMDKTTECLSLIKQRITVVETRQKMLMLIAAGVPTLIIIALELLRWNK